MSKAFFYSNTSVIKDDLLRSFAEMLKSFYYSFKKAFFILPMPQNELSDSLKKNQIALYLFLHKRIK